MKMERMTESLLAAMKDGQEQIRAEMKARQKRMVAKMDSNLEGMKAHHED
jgi:hypothetical protein